MDNYTHLLLFLSPDRLIFGDMIRVPDKRRVSGQWPDKDTYLTQRLLDPVITWFPAWKRNLIGRKIKGALNCPRKGIGIIACKKCTLKTTTLKPLWKRSLSLNRNSNSGNQIAPGIYATTVPISCYFLFQFPCNTLPRNVILSFLWWNRRENILPVRNGKLARCVFGQRSTVLAFPNKMASKRRPCGAESTAKMIFQNDFFKWSFCV